MDTGIEARLAGIRSELERQNELWERARRALMRLGGDQVAVPRDLLRRLDALAQPPTTGGRGIRG